tara:strand:- start:61 stop:237 length:177 start_codon:yes stop_codon:yes gene_type:complete
MTIMNMLDMLYEIEDYKIVYKLFLPLAEQGDEYAQRNLGAMHGNSPNPNQRSESLAKL